MHKIRGVSGEPPSRGLCCFLDGNVWARARSQGHSMNQDVKFFAQCFSIVDKGGELDIFSMVFDARNS